MRNADGGSAWRRFPRPRATIRLRLTLLYGALFLVSGVVLLAIATVPVSIGITVRAAPAPQGFVDNPLVHAVAAQALVEQQHAADLAKLHAWAEVALVIMAAVSVLIGWLVAGRVLRPVRTMAAEVQAISAADLGRRIASDGPDDELKELGRTFDGLLDRVQHALEAQRQFVANASHELRTPLARQRALLQVALSDPDATIESLRAACETLLQSGRQEEELIESLLLLARGERGLERREAADLAAIASATLEVRASEVAARGLRVRTALFPAPTSGDPRLLNQLVANLVDNALRHNVPQGEIEIETLVRDRSAVLRVSNSGPVVPATEVERLFEPFRRLGADRVGHAEGWGLGLSIVRAVTVAHDGTIDARPRAGGGLDVIVTLRLRGVPAPVPPAS